MQLPNNFLFIRKLDRGKNRDLKRCKFLLKLTKGWIDMGNWGKFEFNDSYEGEEIGKVNNVILPEQYIEFMRKHNGGEGDIGETWFVLFPLEELQEINDDYEIEEFLPGHIIIGSNGGGELYGIDKDGNYFNVPALIDEDDVSLLGTDIESLPERVNDLWR